MAEANYRSGNHKMNYKKIILEIAAISILTINQSNAHTTQVNPNKPLEVHVFNNTNNCTKPNICTNSIQDAINYIRNERESRNQQIDAEIIIHRGVYKIYKTINIDNKYDSTEYAKSTTIKSFPGDEVWLDGANNSQSATAISKGESKSNIFHLPLKISSIFIDNHRLNQSSSKIFTDPWKITKWNSGQNCLSSSCFIEIKSSNNKPPKIGDRIEILKEYSTPKLTIKSLTTCGNDCYRLYFNGPLASLSFNQKYPRKNTNEIVYINYSCDTTIENTWSPCGDNTILNTGNELNPKNITTSSLQTIFKIGSSRFTIQNITIEGIGFRNTDWTLGLIDYVPRQANVRAQTDSGITYGRGAVEIDHASNINIKNSKFHNLGGFGIYNKVDANDINITNNSFENIAAGAIYISSNIDISDARAGSNILIAGNHIQNIGVEYHDSVGIFTGYTKRVNIMMNHIKKTPYSAISVGWGWTEKATNLGENFIYKNTIEESMGMLSDGGAIYLLSNQPNTTIRENNILNFGLSNKPAFKFSSAIYLDAGVSGVTIDCNSTSLNTDNSLPHKIFIQKGNSGNTIKECTKTSPIN